MGSATDGQTSLPLLSEVDFTLECSKEFIRPTVSKLVNSQALVNACRLPIGLIVSPMAGDKGSMLDFFNAFQNLVFIVFIN